MTAKTDEQERRDFEVWLRSKWTDGYGCPKSADGSYVDPIAQLLWEAYQAGRAALQSQDAEDDPLQPAANWLFKEIVECKLADIRWGLRIGHNRAHRLFDHARRVEGEGE